MACSLCNEYNNKDNIIFETDNLFVVPTIGSFIDNYELIISKKHINCFGELNDNEFNELENIINWLTKINKKYFNSSTIVFEHGSLSGNNESGKSIVHAHFHIIPFNYSIIDKLNDYEMIEINGFRDLKEIANKYDNYLYIRDIDNKEYIIIHDGLPSQFMRKVIADYIDNKCWDLRKYPYIEKINENVDFYKNNTEIYNLFDK